MLWHNDRGAEIGIQHDRGVSRDHCSQYEMTRSQDQGGHYQGCEVATQFAEGIPQLGIGSWHLGIQNFVGGGREPDEALEL
jgi:hypothetical protein